MRQLAALIALFASAELGAVPPAPMPPGPSPALRLADFQPGPVQCGRFEQVPIRTVAPLPVAAAVAGPVQPIRFAFRIGDQGRPLGIHRIGDAPAPALDIRDLEPALAAWRFAAGQPEDGCEIAFTVRLASVEEADDALLYRYAALGPMQLPGSGGAALLGRAFARLRPPGSICTADPAPQRPLSLLFQSIPEAPSGMSWTFFSYDVDPRGQPVHLRLRASSGNRLLDMDGDIAIGQARFPPMPRIGCLHYFYRVSTEAVPAPAMPSLDFHPPGSSCAPETLSRIAAQLHMSFPAAFMRRHEEGWVTFRYDVDGAGALRNVAILDSEPAAPFGEEVAHAAASVWPPPGAGVQSGCIQRVRFRLAAD